MKFDKTTTIILIFCCVLLFAWEPIGRALGWLPPIRPAATTAPAAPSSAAAAEPSPAPPAEPELTAAEVPDLAPLPAVTLRDKQLALTFNPLDGAIEKVTLEEYLNAGRTAPVELDQSIVGHGALSVFDAGNDWKVLEVLENSLRENRYTLTRRILMGKQSFLLTQEWTLLPGYQVNCRVTFRNPDAGALQFRWLVVNGGDVAPWALLSGDKVRIPSHRLDYLTSNDKFVDIKSTEDDEDYFVQPPPQVKWAAVGNKYFATIMTAAAPFQLHQGRAYYHQDGERYEILTMGAAFPGFQLAGGESKTLELRYYTGPKVISLLDNFDPSTGRVMHLAWGPLDYLARLLLWILVKLHALIGSYGISIIVLTLLVRILFYPATARANHSMKKMQAVQPKIKELREKYKDDPQVMNTKMMELYRTEGINPLGGCLPILLQIPVFFALYATLDGAVELRQVPFLWAHDLAAADTVARIPLYFFSLPINPLVLAMTALMVIQQRMTPMAMDPIQKKMMMAMPIVMLLFLYDLPSGLTLYWTVSNIFSIIQLWLQRRNTNTAGTANCAKTAR